jgi:N-acylneuraminate cytidylyltransferase
MKGHSERVPGKNLRRIAGKPLFHWIVEALLGAGGV